MSTGLKHQPFAKLAPVTRCTASYIKENEELRDALELLISQVGVIAFKYVGQKKTLQDAVDYGNKVLEKLEEG